MIPKSGHRFSDKIMRKSKERMNRRIPRLVILATLVLTAPVLSGCADFDIDKFDILGRNEKKKLPGDRKPVFPEGVPGVTQGIPPEYIKGNQPPPDTAMAPAAVPEANAPPPAAAAAPQPAKQSAAVDPNDEPKPKIRKPKVAKQKLIPDQSPKPAQTQQQDQQQPQQSSTAPNTAPWPAAPQTGTFSR